MKVSIDQNSGFCFGVINAIRRAEELLTTNDTLYCLGDIVHNNEEVNRLSKLGLVVISHEEFERLHDVKVLIRAHGEPPSTYETARKNNIELIDATCRVVLNLQKNIKNQPESFNKVGQILIFGKKGHAEVVGLLGQTQGNGTVISSLHDIDKIDFSRPAKLYAQTTQSSEEYAKIVAAIQQRYAERGAAEQFIWHDTICRNVGKRSEEIQEFAKQYEKIIFVSGEKSSNGLYLFDLCKKMNPNSYFISHVDQLSSVPFSGDERVGICGATSTPMWLMEEVEKAIIDGK